MTQPLFKTHRLFGTDGIRGTPGIYPLSQNMLFRIGGAIACFVLFSRVNYKQKPRVVIGKDTRLSGDHIESILTDAIVSHSVNVMLAGTITTPGLSYLTKLCKADMGIMISASHNKPSDNGIKFFDKSGCKISREEEDQIEDMIFASLTQDENLFIYKAKGKTRVIKNGQAKYVKFLTSTLEGLDLKGMRVAIDCACGAASPFAKKLFNILGAKVYSINDTPEGDNINTGGATDPEFLKGLVLKTSAHIGIAVDGDGDRGILVDENGQVLDGDHTLAVIGRHLLKKNKLPKRAIVATVMSNFGLKVALEESG